MATTGRNTITTLVQDVRTNHLSGETRNFLILKLEKKILRKGQWFRKWVTFSTKALK